MKWVKVTVRAQVGETILGNSFGTSFGGKGANQAVMAAKLGGNTAMITKLGRDTLGANYSDNFAELKVSMAPPCHLAAARYARS